MDYAKINEAHANLIKAIKDSGMKIMVSKAKIDEGGSRNLFIKIKAFRDRTYHATD